MKPQSLELGDLVRVEILEKLLGNECVVSIDGSLLRTQCEFIGSLKPGDTLWVKVTALNPLQFQKVNSKSQMGIDLKA